MHDDNADAKDKRASARAMLRAASMLDDRRDEVMRMKSLPDADPRDAEIARLRQLHAEACEIAAQHRAERDAAIAALLDMTADRDSWRQQCSDRADDAAKAIGERDALRIAMDRLLADIESAVTDRS